MGCCSSNSKKPNNNNEQGNIENKQDNIEEGDVNKTNTVWIWVIGIVLIAGLLVMFM